jgi:hypothetical protein
MIFKSKISSKTFSDKVVLDESVDINFLGLNPVKVGDNILLDIKKVIFDLDRIHLDCIYAEGDTVYGKCLISLMSKK